jgi:hypothetical protein
MLSSLGSSLRLTNLTLGNRLVTKCHEIFTLTN